MNGCIECARVRQQFGELAREMERLKKSMPAMAKTMMDVHNKLGVVDSIPLGEVHISPIHGDGLFAVNDIPAATLLCALDGQYCNWEQLKAAAIETEWNCLHPDIYLVRLLRTKYSYINHSRTPNLYITPYSPFPELITLTDIKAGEELTIDYRMEPLHPDYIKMHGRTYL